MEVYSQVKEAQLLSEACKTSSSNFAQILSVDGLQDYTQIITFQTMDRQQNSMDFNRAEPWH